jgi:hypothetical protein
MGSKAKGHGRFCDSKSSSFSDNALSDVLCGAYGDELLVNEPLYITESGRLALVIHIAYPGDQIIILTGGRLSFILRPVGN